MPMRNLARFQKINDKMTEKQRYKLKIRRIADKMTVERIPYLSVFQYRFDFNIFRITDRHQRKSPLVIPVRRNTIFG